MIWRLGAGLLLGAAFLSQVRHLAIAPYYLSYYKPLRWLAKGPEVMLVGWGEGLDQAAATERKPGQRR